MSTTSNSPTATLITAHAVAKAALPAYSHPSSPKKFTQHQLFACLVLKVSLKLDYRRLQRLLIECADLRNAVGLKRVPHWTSFQKAAARLLSCETVARLLDATIASGPNSTAQVAIDSTGMATGHASAYYTRRRRETGTEGPRTLYHSFPKLGLACDGSTHQVLAVLTGVGPSPDVNEFAPLLRESQRRRKTSWVVADAGYDSEANHRVARDVLKVRTAIPPTRGRPCKDDKRPTGRYRRLMTQRFAKKRYGQRWQVETVMSMVKRRQRDSVWSRDESGWMRDMSLMALTHNILIALCECVFSTEQDKSN